MKNHSEKILIRGVNWVGDAVLTLPAIRTIRKAFPSAYISMLVKPWVSGIFTENKDIDEIILYDERFRGLSGKFRLSKMLRSKNYDRAILLQNAFDAALISWMAKIPERIGYKRDGRGFLLTRKIPVPEKIPGQHQVYYYQNILKSLDIIPVETPPYLVLNEKEKEWAGNTLRTSLTTMNSPVVGINPGAAYGSAKRWPPEYFAELIVRIINELDGSVVIFGSPSEANIAKEITAEINRLKIKYKVESYGSRVLIMAGRTSLRELASLISECDAFITNDSGPMHMASALFVPTVAIFGSTDHTATGPFGEGHKIVTRGLPCSPCLERKCPEGHLNCMTEIHADEVFSALTELLGNNRAVLLDKDGTLIEDRNYLSSFDDLKIIQGVKKSLGRLKKEGFKLIGITNQSGIARGIVDESFVKESNAHLREKLGMDDFLYCPHHPDDHCHCRKPEPMLSLQARLRHRLNLRASYVIGDKESDVLLAENTGSTGILISPTPLFEKSAASYIAKDLNDAAGWILEREKAKAETA